MAHFFGKNAADFVEQGDGLYMYLTQSYFEQKQSKAQGIF